MCKNKVKKSKVQRAKDELRESFDKLKKSAHEGENALCELMNTLWKSLDVEK